MSPEERAKIREDINHSLNMLEVRAFTVTRTYRGTDLGVVYTIEFDYREKKEQKNG